MKLKKKFEEKRVLKRREEKKILFILENRSNHKSKDPLKKKRCVVNEVRQTVLTQKITDSKVLSHKKAHKDAR